MATLDEARAAGKKVMAIIDGKSIYYRGYYAMPNLTTSDGQPTGGVYGFASLAFELVRRICPDYVAVAWDKPHTNIRRRKAIYAGYKSNRHPAPPDFYAQLPTLHELLDALNWPIYECDDYEADDILGTLSQKANAQNIHTILISSDLDMLQLIDDDTEVYALKKGLSNLEKFDVQAFEAKYGIRVEQFLDLKSLKGDSSDCIPGVPGVGEKTGIKLLQKYQTLDGVYQHIDEIKGSLHDKLVAGKDSAYMSRELAKIWCDAPVPLELDRADVTKLDMSKLRQLLMRLQFTSLLKKAEQIFAGAANSGVKGQDTAAQPAKSPVGDSMPASASVTPENGLTLTAPLSPVRIELGINTQLELKNAIVAKYNDHIYMCDADAVKGASPAAELVAYKLTPDVAAKILAGRGVIAHDIKALTEYFLAQSLSVDYTATWDTRHAAFLINSRVRAKSLDELLTEQGISEPTATEYLAATVQLCRLQLAELAKTPQLLTLARRVDFPLQITLARIEHRGMLVDVHILQQQSAKLGDEIATLETQIYVLAGEEFNLASPKQLSAILFDKLGLPHSGKMGKFGAYSTSAKVLDKLAPDYPVVSLILHYRELAKLKSTYLDALPQNIAADGRVHTTFSQDVTATGRLSSSNPNLQNIPTRSEQGHMVKCAFVAPAGKVLVNADYAQFELRLAAALGHDTDMIQMFADPKNDIHVMTAAQAYGVDPLMVTPEMRRHAKVINFGILYGMSAKGLADATGMSLRQASDFIKKYFAARQPIKNYLDQTLEKAKALGYVETLFGRRRYTPDVHSRNGLVRAAAERAAANMPIQGTEADLMKMAMLRVESVTGASQIMQVHDSITVECPAGEAERVSAELKEIMENIYPDLGVRLLVDVKIGQNWGEV